MADQPHPVTDLGTPLMPLRFGDGYLATATIISFAGLTDARQHVALELGRPTPAGVSRSGYLRAAPYRDKRRLPGHQGPAWWA